MWYFHTVFRAIAALGKNTIHCNRLWTGGLPVALIDHDELIYRDVRARKLSPARPDNLKLINDRSIRETEMKVRQILAVEIAVRFGQTQLSLGAGITAEVGCYENTGADGFDVRARRRCSGIPRLRIDSGVLGAISRSQAARKQVGFLEFAIYQRTTT